mmetsp:Transcript_32947/g.99712  ORF Transcript_32947/g.99712 Transcript_32947/m.99712 type:complete len:88 (-) Transcript_32947:36-299(-)
MESFRHFAVGTTDAAPTATPFALTLLANDENEQLTRRISRKHAAAGDDLEFGAPAGDDDDAQISIDDFEMAFANDDVETAKPLCPAG